MMPIPILQGTLDLMILRTLATMGPQHAYGIANRLQQVSEDALNLNQGTIYPALVRLEQHGWTRGSWSKTEKNREAKYYAITKAGLKAHSVFTSGAYRATAPNAAFPQEPGSPPSKLAGVEEKPHFAALSCAE